MSDNLENLWSKLSLTEDELIEVVEAKDWIEKAKEIGRNCLIGRLVLNKRVNIEAMKKVLSIVWKISTGMTVKEVGEKMFIFQFGDNMEKERVLLRQPWTFNKSLLVLDTFEDQTKPEEVLLQWCVHFRCRSIGYLLD
ncbi:hypothetical protein CRYUN_Cryun04dG0149500 [Craigia yunnanensis]